MLKSSGEYGQMSNQDKNGCWQIYDNNRFAMILLKYLLVKFVFINYNDPYHTKFTPNISEYIEHHKIDA